MTDPLRSFTVLGHRGAKGHAPENTAVSFEKAIELGATMAELDIHLSKDNQLIVMHDADVSRTTNGSGLIADLTLAEIKQLDAGSFYDARYADQRVPTLQEVIDVTKGRIQLNVEMKKGEHVYEGMTELMVETLVSNDMVDQVVISSFEPRYLKETRAALADIQVALLYSKAIEDPVQLALDEGWDGLHPNIKRVDRALVEAAHDNGLLVRGWNPNEAEGITQLLDCGVDGVGTDFPELLLQLAREKRLVP